MSAQNLYKMGQRPVSPQSQRPAAPAGWTCPCGQTGNTGKFCQSCGRPKPAPEGNWKCSCGAAVTGKFCPECGDPFDGGDVK